MSSNPALIFFSPYSLINIDMYVTDFIYFNQDRGFTVRGVLMHRRKRDLCEGGEGKILIIYSIHDKLPKRSHRTKIWEKIWTGKEKSLRILASDILNNQRKLGNTEQIFGIQVRTFRRTLDDYYKAIFDKFYYK